MAMAAMGMLGGGTGNPGLGGGPDSPQGKLMATEDFMEQFDQPGVQFIDPGDVFDQAFTRADNTDWGNQIGEDGQLMTPFEIIDTTNSALLTAMAFSNPETEQWLESALNNAAQEYMLLIADEGMAMSYPAFLREMGIDQML